jgi:SAM-dependent methyltransferase
VSDFGEQWTRHTDNSGFYGSEALFLDISGPLIGLDDVRGKTVADIGSGTGRIVNMLLAAGASHVTAIEPSESWRVVAANTEKNRDRVSVIHGDGLAIPRDGRFDLVVSIGVLHHIEDPAPVVQAACEALKPGGIMLIWLYGHEGNGFYLGVIEPLRAVTVRLPHPLLSGLCYAFDAIAMVYSAACRVLPLPMRGYMRSVYSRLAADKRRLVVYDQLNPAYAKYYRGDEAEALLVDNGFTEVRTHHRHGYSWSVVGRKPLRPGSSPDPIGESRPPQGFRPPIIDVAKT